MIFSYNTGYIADPISSERLRRIDVRNIDNATKKCNYKTKHTNKTITEIG